MSMSLAAVKFIHKPLLSTDLLFIYGIFIVIDN